MDEMKVKADGDAAVPSQPYPALSTELSVRGPAARSTGYCVRSTLY